jgi:hypothetical protein
MMPSKPELNISSGGIVWLGNTICINASSVGPDNDNINFSWNWGDVALPDSMSGQSGRNVTGCHSWNRTGTFKINVTASNSNGSNSSKINISVLNPSPPETPRGEHVAYLGKSCTYKTEINRDIPITNANFSFNWCWDGDGPDSCANTQAEHIWSSPGTKKVRVRALDIQGNPGDWSKELIVDVYNQTYVECGQDLQNAINISSNYTELILNCSRYNVGEIIIMGKDHLALKPREHYRAELSSDQNVTQRLMLENSDFINISRLNLTKAVCCLTMDNSSYCKVSDCIFEFRQSGVGIGIKSGGFNEFSDNRLINRYPNNSSGILIDGSNNNIIKNNSIRFLSGNNHFCHINFFSPNNQNHVIRTNQMEELRIKIGRYIIIWEERADSLGDCSSSGSGIRCNPTIINMIWDSIDDINRSDLIFNHMESIYGM